MEHHKKLEAAGYAYTGGTKLGHNYWDDRYRHTATGTIINVHHKVGDITAVYKDGKPMSLAAALKEERVLFGFKDFIKESFVVSESDDHWADHSDKYQLKKGEAKPTEVHSGQARGWDKPKAPKHIMHVIHKETGEEIGKIEPYSATEDKKKPGARIVSSRKYVTRHSFSFHKGHGPESHKMGTYITMKHRSPKEALRVMAREHQAHLRNKNAAKD